jgi:hypothetical protein
MGAKKRAFIRCSKLLQYQRASCRMLVVVNDTLFYKALERQQTGETGIIGV